MLGSTNGKYIDPNSSKIVFYRRQLYIITTLQKVDFLDNFLSMADSNSDFVPVFEST